jgi:non-ribosomal peptide synthetase component E (peptide arylation enzyme)
MRTSFHHQSEAQPPNGPLTVATSPDTARFPAREALVGCGQRYTYAALREEVRAFAKGLHARSQITRRFHVPVMSASATAICSGGCLTALLRPALRPDWSAVRRRYPSALEPEWLEPGHRASALDGRLSLGSFGTK